MSPSKKPPSNIIIRQTQPGDFDEIIEMGRLIYSDLGTWSVKHLESHQQIFPQGQLVAVEEDTGKLVGSSSSLIVLWDDYHIQDTWKDFTDNGMFTNHDTQGRTLYGADVMVHPHVQGRGIGKLIYKARRDLTRGLGLRRIRAGARLRNYGKFQHEMSPEEYVQKIINGDLGDPTLSFQVKQGFRIIGVVRDYLHCDEESCGHAAVIEWVNHQVAQRKDTYGRDPKFAKHRKPKDQPPRKPAAGG